MKWSGMECNGTEWNGMHWNAIEKGGTLSRPSQTAPHSPASKHRRKWARGSAQIAALGWTRFVKAAGPRALPEETPVQKRDPNVALLIYDNRIGRTDETG